MIDQFEADKSLHVALTDNLQFMITDNRKRPPGNPRAIQMVQILEPGLKVDEKPQGLARGMLALATD